MLLTKLVDTTARGLVYEAAGTVGADVLEAGVASVRRFGVRSRSEVAVLEADPTDHRSWLGAISFSSRRIFRPVDVKVMLLARRMLLTHRQQTQPHPN